MANNVYNPPVPYSGPIPGPIAPGFSVIIRGSSHPSCNRFAINLQCGPNINPRDDVLLHIGVDFVRNCVIRNSIHNMNWGPEESQQGYFPFTRGAPFEFHIRCEPAHFTIAINGQNFAQFEHRIVYHRGSHITIDGEIIVASIEYNSSQSIPHGGVYPQSSHLSGYNNSSLPYPVSGSMPLPNQPHPAAMQGPPVGTTYSGPQQNSPQSLSSPYGGGQYGGSQYGWGQYGGGQYGGGQYGHQKQGVVGGLLKKIGVGGAASTGVLAATAGAGYLGSKKARKAALKYGIPLAGAGLGAYAISRAFHSGSSSSSSSSSDEE